MPSLASEQGAADAAILWTSLSVLVVAVATETALRNFLWTRMQERIGPGPRLERLKKRLVKEHRLLDGASALRTISSYFFLLSMLGVFAADFGPQGEHIFAQLGLALLVMLAGVHGIVRGIARAAPERVLLLVLPLGSLLSTIALPIAWLSEFMGRLACRMVGLADRDTNEEARHEILDAVSDGEREGAIGEAAGTMIENIIEVQDVPVSRIMTPRTSVFAIPVEADLAVAAKAVVEHGHSRIPVHKGGIDNVVGILLSKDLLRCWGSDLPPGGLTTLLRAPLFVPESRLAKDLLADLRRDRVHMAIVLDEYGGMSGIVTIEDILEEIVGEIADEYDTVAELEVPGVKRIAERIGEVDGIAHINDVNKALQLALPEDRGFDTIAGYVSAEVGRVPRTGEHFDLGGARFDILDADARRIRRLKVSVPE